MKNRFTPLHRALLAAALVTAANFSAQAQSVGIGTTAPDASAALDVVASAKGALLPRMTAAGRTGILSPATGLIVFQTDGTPGFYYNSGTPATPVWQQIATAAGTSTGFIQNQNAADQVASFRISGSGSTLGNFGVGTSAPQLRLDVANGNIGLRNNAAWDHMYWFHDGSTAFMRAGGAETGLALQVGASATGTYGDASQAYRDVMRLLPNGNVGIGTTTPIQKLEVEAGGIRASGNGAFTAVLATNQGAHLQWNRTGGEGETWLINHMGGGNGNAGIRFAGITTGTGTVPTEWARFLNNGNFGIGTTAPSQKLDVNGNVRIEGLTVAGLVQTDALGNLSSATAASLDPTTASNGLTKVGSDFRLGGTLTSATTIAQGTNFFALTDAGQIGLGTAAATGIGAHVTVQAASATEPGLQVGLSGASAAIAFKTEHNGSNFIVRPVSAGGTSTAIENTGGGALAINPTIGNVGIGTTAPTEKLDVVGNIQSSANIAVDYGNANAGSVANSLRFGPTNSGEAIGSKRTATGNQFGLDFYTTSTNRMSITSGGNVGIGTTTPSALLDVNGSTRLRGLTVAGLVQTDASGNLSSASTASFGTSFIQNQNAADQAANFRIAGTGSVGSLQAVGATAAVQTISTQGGYLQWNRTATEGETWLINQQGSGTANAGIRFGGATTANVVTEWGRFLNNGNFGLGTAAPTARLHARGTGNAYPATTGTAQSVGLISRYQTSDNAILDLGGNSGNGFWLQSTDITTLGLNYPLMLNPNGGNVGVGTTAPLAKLAVNGAQVLYSGLNNASARPAVGTARIAGEIGAVGQVAGTTPDLTADDGFLRLSAGGGSNPLRKSYIDLSGFSNNADMNENIVLGTINTERMRITQTGNVGIGTSAPTEKLVVSTSVGSTPNTTNFASVETVVNPLINSTQGINIIKNDGQVRGFKLYQTGSDDGNSSFRIASTNAGLESDAITIRRNTGNVGIGTTAPIQKLEVEAGGIRASGNGAFTAVLATNQGAHLQWNRTGGEGETWLINHMGGGNGNAGIRFAGITTGTGTVPTEWARFNNAGNFGIGTTAPSATLEVAGYTKLSGPAAVVGATVPGIATALFTGTLPTTANTNGFLSLGGIATSRILSVSITALANNVNNYFPPNQTASVGFGTGYEYGYYLETNSNTLRLVTGANSVNVQGGAVKALVTYMP